MYYFFFFLHAKRFINLKIGLVTCYDLSFAVCLSHTSPTYVSKWVYLVIVNATQSLNRLGNVRGHNWCRWLLKFPSFQILKKFKIFYKFTTSSCHLVKVIRRQMVKRILQFNGGFEWQNTAVLFYVTAWHVHEMNINKENPVHYNRFKTASTPCHLSSYFIFLSGSTIAQNKNDAESVGKLNRNRS